MSEALYTIGDLARHTGLPVKTIRFYADEGIVPETGRTPAGYRVYDIGAIARLDLVRTLRELGVDLPTVRRVLAREATLAEVAAAHAEALDVQLRTLRLRRAVLSAVAARGATHQEMDLMHRIARMSDLERKRVIEDFVEDTFGGVDANPELVELVRAATPDLPDDATPEQVEAWIELAELTQDPDFRTSVRAMAQYQAAERAEGDTTGLHHELTVLVRERIGRRHRRRHRPAIPRRRPHHRRAGSPIRDHLRQAGRPGPAHMAVAPPGGSSRPPRGTLLAPPRGGEPMAGAGRRLGPVFEWFQRALRVRMGRLEQDGAGGE